MAKAAKAFTHLQNAHQALIASIENTIPNNITLLATPDTLEARKDHLNQILTATLTYAKALIADTNYVSPVKVADHTDCLEDAIGDIIGALMQAEHRLEQEAA